MQERNDTQSYRWIGFILFTFGVVMFFTMRDNERRREAARVQAEKQELLKRAAQAETERAKALADATSATLQLLAKTTGLDGVTSEAIASVRKESSLRAPTDAELAAARAAEAAASAALDPTTAPSIEVATKDMHVTLSTVGGIPIRWEILGLPGTQLQTPQGARTPGGTHGTDLVTTHAAVNLIPLLQTRGREYPLMVESRPLDIFNGVPMKVEKKQLDGGVTEVSFLAEGARGVRLTRTYRFPETGYLVDVKFTIENRSEQRKLFDDEGLGFATGWQGGFLQPEEISRITGDVFALFSNGTDLIAEHVKMGGEPYSITGDVRWAGIEKKYFLAALVPLGPGGKYAPASAGLATVRERDLADEYKEGKHTLPLSVVLQQSRFELQPGESKTFEFALFAGPKKHDLLKATDEKLGFTGDAAKTGLASSAFHNVWMRGLVRPIALLLLNLLEWLHGITVNYGIAIILLTSIVRIAVFPLTHKAMKIQAKSMAEQARLKPYIDEINEKYKDNPAAKNQAMMKLYQEHGINPFGMLRGCLPVLAQMPIFIALYVLLDQAIELRGQRFLWIVDLSQPDRLFTIPGLSLPLLGGSFNLLPILMGLTQVISSRLSTTNITDPMQKQMMTIMPIMFIFFMYQFPSGLMLYWVVSNTFQIVQQVLTNRMMQNEPAAAPAR